MPSVRVSVNGDLEKLRRISHHLKETGDKSLRREVIRELNRATKEPKAAVMESLPAYLPDRYAGVLAGTLRLTTSRRASGVRVTAKAKGNPRPRYVGRIDRGILRHPLFGSRDRWFNQKVRPGFFTDPMKRSAPQMKKAIVEALDRIARKITS